MKEKRKNIELIAENNHVILKITGKLEAHDYDFFVPEIEGHIKQFGKLNILVELKDFQGWTAGAAWEDAKFGMKHFNDIKRLAIVGETGWEKGMTVFAKAFTRAKVRYFDMNIDGKVDAAKSWITEA